MATKIVRFTVPKGVVGPGAHWDTCVVQRGVAGALKVNVNRVNVGFGDGSVESKNGNKVRDLVLFPRTKRLIKQHDTGLPLTPGTYSVKVVG